MPTIKSSLKDLQNLIGKKVSIDELDGLLSYCKGGVEGYDKQTDELTIEVQDTNLPYLWSSEGIARLLKGVIGKEKGIPVLNVKKSSYEVVVDKSVSAVRPFIVAFAAKGKKVDDSSIKQMVQLQEKLCESFGKRRSKVAVGIYRLNKINFPVHYKATEPESVEFIPLDFKRKMTQQEILEIHPKGKDYAWILKDAKKYPILMDSSNNVLSFPPIINSVETGKIEEGDSELFFEATGTDLKALNLAANIFAYALADRGYDIYSVSIKYDGRKLVTPELKTETIKVDRERAEELLGISLNAIDFKKLLEKARYNVNGNTVEIPSHRDDILHPVDVMEDAGIMYGYDSIKGLALSEYTTGRTTELVKFVNNVRELMVGQGYQEIMSPILSNKEVLYNVMNLKDFGTIEIGNPMSETYSCLRSWLIPVLMDVIAKNKHVDCPQKIFEEGLVAVRKGDSVVEYERLAVVSANVAANFTEIRQALDYIMHSLGVEYSVQEVKHPSFAEGRTARLSVAGKEIAFVGEINPAVLDNFGLKVPVAAFELNLSELFELVRK